MGGCGGKTPKTKSQSKGAYTPKKAGGYRPSGASPFGTPKVKMSFGARGR